MSYVSERWNAGQGPLEIPLRRRSLPSLDVSAAASEGHEQSIPPTFMVLFDLAVLAIAFALTRPVAPFVQKWLLTGGLLGLKLPAWLVLPAAASPANFEALPSMMWVLFATAPATVLFLALLGGYRPLVGQSRTQLALGSLASWLLSLSAVTLTLYTLRDAGPSRVFVFTFGALGFIGLLGYRASIWIYQRRLLMSGAYARNVILVGQPSAVAWAAEHIRRHVPTTLFHLAGWLNVRLNDASDAEQITLPCLAAAENLGDLLIHHPYHEVIAIQSAGDSDWLRQVIEDCDYFRVRLRIVPEALMVGKLRDLRLTFRSEPLRLPEVVLEPPHHQSESLFVKRVIDVAVAAVLLVAVAPVFALIAIAIKLTTPDLPVFYPWRVIGLNGHPFTGYKFTTMVADSDHRLDELRSRNEMRGPVFKVKDDPRITQLGRFLRKYSLNELPQLWSVLKGDMSLVGPRPAFRHELDRYELWHKRKLCVKPGMTCLWQVSGRNRISDFDEWVRLDLEYMDRWSLALDLRILVRTIATVLSGNGW